MAKPFTAKSIEQFKPHKTRREIQDGGCKGLYLFIQPLPSGSKSWKLLLSPRNGRKPYKLHLGSLDLSGVEIGGSISPQINTPLTLTGARALATELYRQRATGKDVVADYKNEKQIRKTKASEPDTKFAAVAEQFIAEHARPSTRRWKETAHCLGLDYPNDDDEPIRLKGGLAEQWRDREISQITSDDVYRIIDDAKRHGIPGLPRRTKGISNSRGRAMARALSKLFGWALQHRKIKASPSVGVYVPPAPKKRERVLSPDEIVCFWRATDQLNEPFGAMLKVLLLTAARLREVAGMRKAELSEDNSVWTIPASRTKNKREHIVPLPPLARDIIAEVKQIKGQGGYIFSTTGTSPVSGFSKIKVRLDELMTDNIADDWRLHDLRRSAATTMAELPPKGLGIQPHIVEAILNHVSGHKVGVAGVYNLASYPEEKKVALERFAMHIDGLVKGKPANVTALSSRRKKGK